MARSEPGTGVAGGGMLGFELDGLTFQVTPDTADALRAGELDPDVAYMQGRLKVAGDMSAFWDLLPLARNDRFRAALPG